MFIKQTFKLLTSNWDELSRLCVFTIHEPDNLRLVGFYSPIWGPSSSVSCPQHCPTEKECEIKDSLRLLHIHPNQGVITERSSVINRSLLFALMFQNTSLNKLKSMSNVLLQVQEWSASENVRATMELQSSTKVWPQHAGDQKVGHLAFMRTAWNLCACVKDESGLHRLSNHTWNVWSSDVLPMMVESIKS